jgi:MFS family permease
MPTTLRNERQFMLLITGQTISSAGNAVAPIAIAFAVLQLTGSARDLGLVVAGRSAALAVCVLFGGVLADRIPRQAVLIGGALIAGASEAATAALLLSHTARIGEVAVLQVVNGATSAFVFPAAQGALPQSVSAEHLHRANVVSRMCGNATSILGAAAGGILVAAAGPGWAVAGDSATFFASAAFFGLLRLTPVARNASEAETGTEADDSGAGVKSGIFHELAVGWGDFRSRIWLWSIVLQFCFVNVAIGGVVDVLGPLTAKVDLGGAHAWGLIMSAFSAGFLAGGLLASRLRYVRRPLLIATFGSLFMGPFLALIAIPAVLPVLCLGSFAAGIGTEVFGVEWSVTLQRQVPADRLARVVSYDMLGSIVCLPLGQAVIGITQSAIGLRTSVLICVGLAVVPSLAVLGVRDVRTLAGESRQAATT